MTKILTEMNVNWPEFIPGMDREYSEILSMFKERFPLCFNVWDSLNASEKCITYGKTQITDDGKL